MTDEEKAEARKKALRDLWADLEAAEAQLYKLEDMLWQARQQLEAAEARERDRERAAGVKKKEEEKND